MTAQLEPLRKQERLSDMLGESWERLFNDSSDESIKTLMRSRKDEACRQSRDIKSLPADDITIFGRCPETDAFTTVVCPVCGFLLVPHALRRHMEKRHGKEARTTRASEDDPSKMAMRPRRWDESRHRTNVKRLPPNEMALFGRCPETDSFITVMCSLCGCVVMQHALQRHLQKRHGDDPAAELKAKSARKSSSPKKPGKSSSQSPPELMDEPDGITDTNSSVCCSLCATLVPPQAFRRHVLKAHGDDTSAKPLLTSALKLKTVKKPAIPKKLNKSSSSSPPELTEELSKDPKKLNKNKKCKSPIPPELEPILPAAKRVVISGTGPPELMPIELPRKSSSKKKNLERKADKVYDPNKHCGVINDTGKPCLRSILCKVHLVALKRAVQNRDIPYDTLTKMLKSQNDEEKKPKLEPVSLPPAPLTPTQPQVCVLTVSATEDWPEPPSIKEEDPPVKRLKTEELDEDQYALPSDLEALIEATLKDVEENEPLPVIPVVPRPEPIVRWSIESTQLPPASYSPPPNFQLDDILFHTTHPRPLATHTFNCRLIGGLLSTNKKGYTFRKNVQSVLASRGGFSDTSNKLPGFSLKSGQTPQLKKSQVPTAAARRKRRSSGGTGTSAATSTSSASDIISGLLQRAGQPSTNGVPLRLFQGTVQQSTFIQLNLCPSK